MVESIIFVSEGGDGGKGKPLPMKGWVLEEEGGMAVGAGSGIH